MKTLGLKDFFNITGYNWEDDKEKISNICYYTKTRAGSENQLRSEQTFLIKAFAEYIGAQSFFEVGTGRGTSCYATSLIPGVKYIHTVDILRFNQKFKTYIGGKPDFVSLSDIRDMIPYGEKNKVRFHHRDEFSHLRAQFPRFFDFAFIDGEHDNKKVILEDYDVCRNVVREGGYILWDDYEQSRISVKSIVDELLTKDNQIDAFLIEHSGHLFGEPKSNQGVVVMATKPLIESMLNGPK